MNKMKQKYAKKSLLIPTTQINIKTYLEITNYRDYKVKLVDNKQL